MKITIGTTNSDRRVLHKNYNLPPENTYEVTVKDNCSVLNPVFILTYRNGVAQCNYCKCESFGRFYYIDDVVMLTGGRCEIHCSVDVLESYQSQIENLTVNVSRQADSGKRNPKISDSAKPLQVNTATDTYVFNSSPFTNHVAFGSYILTVLGGGH